MKTMTTVAATAQKQNDKHRQEKQSDHQQNGNLMTVMNFMMCWLLWIKHPVLRHHHPSNPNLPLPLPPTTAAFCLCSIVAGVCECRFPRLNGFYYYYYYYFYAHGWSVSHHTASIPNGVLSVVCMQIEIRLIILIFKRDLRFFRWKCTRAI